jgi:hypothetical protein
MSVSPVAISIGLTWKMAVNRRKAIGKLVIYYENGDE